MKVLFLRAYDFPFGGAPQNRLLGICKALSEKGFYIEVHQFAPSKLKIDYNHLRYKVYENIPIYNHAWRWSPLKNKYEQLIGVFEGMTKAIVAIVLSHIQRRVDYIFFNSDKLIYTVPIFAVAKLLKIGLGRDFNEYPLALIKNSQKHLIYLFGGKHLMYVWYDVAFIISKTLINYYCPLLRKRTRILYLPVTVDLARFPQIVNNLSHKNIITYCGDLSDSKDGILILLQAFALLHARFEKYILRIIGATNDADQIKRITQFIEKNDLNDFVILVGYIHPNDIPFHLQNSRLLVLSRPNNRQAQGGFPTKLGEYLASGIPVAVTSVGEIPAYLQDNINAYLAQPDSVESFYHAMTRALDDDVAALRVGKEGRETAIRYFSTSAQGQILSDFLRGKEGI